MFTISAFQDLSDKRYGPALQYHLHEIIFMVFSAVLCECNTWCDIEQWADDNRDWLSQHFPQKENSFA